MTWVKILFVLLLKGAPILKNFMSKRRVVVTRDDLTLLLLNDDMEEPPEIHKFSAHAANMLHQLGNFLSKVMYWNGITTHLVTRRYWMRCLRIQRGWRFKHRLGGLEGEDFCPGVCCEKWSRSLPPNLWSRYFKIRWVLWLVISFL